MQMIWKTIPDGEKAYKENRYFRELFSKLLLEKKLRREVIEEDYDNPSWSHKQAHRNGYNQAVNEMIKILYEGDT